METIYLKKKWGGHEPGDALAIWESGPRPGVPCVDPQRAAALLKQRIAEQRRTRFVAPAPPAPPAESPTPDEQPEVNHG